MLRDTSLAGVLLCGIYLSLKFLASDSLPFLVSHVFWSSTS